MLRRGALALIETAMFSGPCNFPMGHMLTDRDVMDVSLLLPSLVTRRLSVQGSLTGLASLRAQ